MSGGADTPAVGRRGILFVVSAPSGAGKTTLVKLLLGEIPPDSGTVRLGKVQVFAAATAQPATAARPSAPGAGSVAAPTTAPC